MRYNNVVTSQGNALTLHSQQFTQMSKEATPLITPIVDKRRKAADAYAFENTTNKFRPKTPLQQSIDELRGQIKAMQKLTSLGGIELSVHSKQLKNVVSHLTKTDVPKDIRAEHAAQNMQNVFTELAEEQERATKS